MDGKQKQVQQLPPAAEEPNGGSGSGNGNSISRAGENIINSDNRMPFPGLRALVVDDDQTSLKVVAAMLKTSHYKVVSVPGAANALSILKRTKGGFDLVITNAHMAGMDGFQLMDQIRKLYKIPVIMTSADNELKLVTKGLERGACYFLMKPYNMGDMRNIWQHVFRKRRDEMLEIEQTGSVGREPAASRPATARAAARNKQVLIHNVEELDEDDSASSSVNHGVHSRSQNRKRKEHPSSSNINNRNGGEEGDGDDDDDEDRQAQKKARVVWNTDLHNQFLDAIERLGIDKAVPKKILELMNVQGLTRENVASHLQKYRIFVRRLVEAGQADEPSAAMSIANGALKSSFAAGHSSEFLMSLQQGGYPQYSGAATHRPVPPPITMQNDYTTTRTYNRGQPATPQRSSSFFDQYPITNNAYIPTAHNPIYGQHQPAVLPMSNNLQGMNTVLPAAPYGLPPYSTQPQQNVVTTGFGMDPYYPSTRISAPLSNSFYGAGGHTSPGSSLVMGTAKNATMPINMGVYQQQNLAMRPSKYGVGALDQNFNSMNMNVQAGMTNLQTNNPMVTSGNMGSGLFGNNFNQNLSFNTGFTNDTYAGFPLPSTAAYGEIGMNSQMGAAAIYGESSSSRPDVNLCYTNLLNQNLSRIIGKRPMPLSHPEPQAVAGSPLLADIQQFGMPNSGYATIAQDGGQAASMVGFTGANNNQLSSSPVFTNVNMTSSQQQQQQQQQQYSPLVSPSPPKQQQEQLLVQEQPQQEQQEQQQEEKTNEELSGDFFDLMTSNTTAEINSLPSLFDDDLIFNDFYFKQYDDNSQAGAEQQLSLEEVVDPNFGISAYQMDGL